MNKKNSVTTDSKHVVQDQSRPTSRRKALRAALAGGAVVTVGSVPAKWVAPVVDSMVLPAHAQTSIVGSSTPDTCGGAPEGCYTYGAGFSFSFSWPGGVGPFFSVPYYQNSECLGTPFDTATFVVAANEAEAALAMDCIPFEMSTDPAPPGRCRFFVCVQP